MVSLNPLPPERLLRGSSERSETTPGDEDDDGEDASSSESAETNASINGDVEDNLQERRLKNVFSKLWVPIPMCTYLQEENHKAAAALELMRRLEPFNPDPEHLDPHMEQLCRDYILEDLILRSLNHHCVLYYIYILHKYTHDSLKRTMQEGAEYVNRCHHCGGGRQ